MSHTVVPITSQAGLRTEIAKVRTSPALDKMRSTSRYIRLYGRKIWVDAVSSLFATHATAANSQDYKVPMLHAVVDGIRASGRVPF